MRSQAEAELIFFVFYYGWFEVLGFKNLAAIETFYVVDAIAAGDYLGAGMVTGGLHKDAY